jgi:hypothetical protein
VTRNEVERLRSISTALARIHVEQPHHNRASLYKYRATRCKKIQKSSTRLTNLMTSDF